MHWPCENIASEQHLTSREYTQEPLDGYLLHSYTQTRKVSFFLSSGVWNIWNPKTLTVFLSHIKILIEEIYLTLSTMDGTEYKQRKLGGLYPSFISQYSLFLFSLYYSHFGLLLPWMSTLRRYCFFFLGHSLPSNQLVPQPSDVT